jgi:hypothetical protein
METLLNPSQADWALAKRRERVLSKLVESKGVFPRHDSESVCRASIIASDGF